MAVLAPVGSLVICDDTNGNPAKLVSAADGAILASIAGYPAGELAATLPTGERCVQNGALIDAVAFLNAALVVTDTWDPPAGASIYAILSNRSDTFYVFYLYLAGGYLQALSAVGVPGVLHGPMEEMDELFINMAVNDAGTRLYGLRQGTNVYGRAYDLENDVYLGEVGQIGVDEQANGEGDGFVAPSDGSFAVAISAAMAGTVEIRRINMTTGGTVTAYPVTVPMGGTLHHFELWTDGLSFWTWVVNAADDEGTFTQVRLSDGMELESFTVPQTVSGEDPETISNSCPLSFLTAALPATLIETVTVDCETDNIHITGTSLTLVDLVITGPDGDEAAYTVVSASTEEIVVSLDDGFEDGNYCASIGEDITVCAVLFCNSTTYPLVRLRRFQGPYNQNLMQFVSRLEVIGQSGVGNSDAPNPTFTLRVSKDGGQTWGISRTMSIGAAAAFTKRIYTLNLGRARNWVFEICTSDPVFIGLLDCTVDVEEGTS